MWYTRVMKKYIVANWKMNPQSSKEALSIYKETINNTKTLKNCLAIVCAPYPFIFELSKIKSSKVLLGVQDISSATDGAYTGQVSVGMLKETNVVYSIVGHSESRASGDTNALINKKIKILLKEKLSPILCVGESVRDAHGEYLSLIKIQLQECLSSVSKAQLAQVIIAYEPIWAIGSGALREATPEEFTEMQIFIKKVIADMYTVGAAHNIPILYGGSVHPKNAKQFLDAHADGLLVGRDSLSTSKFRLILMATQ
jgi:triosephosphate isomerase (TIM)